MGYEDILLATLYGNRAFGTGKSLISQARRLKEAKDNYYKANRIAARKDAIALKNKQDKIAKQQKAKADALMKEKKQNLITDTKSGKIFEKLGLTPDDVKRTENFNRVVGGINKQTNQYSPYRVEGQLPSAKVSINPNTMPKPKQKNVNTVAKPYVQQREQQQKQREQLGDLGKSLTGANPISKRTSGIKTPTIPSNSGVAKYGFSE